jgi:hypothetical protein
MGVPRTSYRELHLNESTSQLHRIEPDVESTKPALGLSSTQYAPVINAFPGADTTLQRIHLTHNLIIIIIIITSLSLSVQPTFQCRQHTEPPSFLHNVRSPKHRETQRERMLNFEFAFDNPVFSDRILNLEVIPNAQAPPSASSSSSQVPIPLIFSSSVYLFIYIYIYIYLFILFIYIFSFGVFRSSRE